DSSQARNHWRDLLELALTAGTDVVITRQNKPIVAVMAYEDYLAVRDALTERRSTRQSQSIVVKESRATMFASEQVLMKEWDTPEEDEAWQDL
ncbi:MAG: type II toxin-antitoxin system prevent-host-death family antitoxin, partial [Chloroflexi bacterium]|nr:type II toxin-antitoxin system prevent-host-death family antitoxin [Chloroflexota bacterium]